MLNDTLKICEKMISAVSAVADVKGNENNSK